MVYEVDLQKPNYAHQLLSMGVTASVHYAPLDTKIPDGMDAYDDQKIVDLGWLDESGLTEEFNAESNSFTPWQAETPIREQTTSREFTFNFTLWSASGLANALYYDVPADDMEEKGGYVEFTQGGSLPDQNRFRLFIDLLDGNKHRRFILPNASVSSRDGITYSKNEITGYGLTVKANFDSEVGSAVIRRFAEGWKPGTQGTTIGAGDDSASGLGEWHTRPDGVAGRSDDPGNSSDSVVSDGDRSDTESETNQDGEV